MMARESDRYRLWQHDVRLPKKSERTVIAKVVPMVRRRDSHAGLAPVGRRPGGSVPPACRRLGVWLV